MTKKTITTFTEAKAKGEKLALLTAYDFSTARQFAQTGVDALLVGDSLGMVMLGYPDTLSVTMEDMLHHCKAVVRGAPETLVIGDMPFMSYQTSVYDAVVNAGRLVKEAGVQAVKLEGGALFCEHVQALVRAQIPVIGHVGLTPQSVHTFGGFKVQGKNEEDAGRIIDDAIKLQEAGVFALILEGIPYPLAQSITEALSIPTIGIGAGPFCDGQILVYQDLFKLYTDFTPKFVRVFDDIGSRYRNGVEQYLAAVKDGSFPDVSDHSFSP